MQQMKRLVLLLSVAVLAACGGGGGDSPEPGAKPPSTQNPGSESVAGQDSDQNGIRDDVDQLIVSQFGGDPALKQEAENIAKQMQASLTVDLASTPNTGTLVQETYRVNACAVRNLGMSKVQELSAATREIYALTLNSLERIEKRQAYLKAANLANIELTRPTDCSTASSQDAPLAALIGPNQAALVCGSKAMGFFINGVNKPSPEEVAQDAEVLAMGIAQSGANIQDVRALYNPSEKLILDVFKETLLQKLAENTANASWWLRNAIRSAFGRPSELPEDDIARLQASLANKVARAFDTEESRSAYMNMHRQVKAATDQGSALIVSHSQGNMFGNQLYAALMATPGGDPTITRRVQVVNVATPAHSAPSAKYVTISEDFIINALARLISLGAQPLPANLSLVASGQNIDLYDKTGHGFREIYLNSALATYGITLGLVNEAIEQLDGSPTKPTLAFKVSAGVTYGFADYSVTEPDGKRFTVSLSGESLSTNKGSLIERNCSNVREGEYKITLRAQTVPLDFTTLQMHAFGSGIYLDQVGSLVPRGELYPGDTSPIWFWYPGAPFSQPVVRNYEVATIKVTRSGKQAFWVSYSATPADPQ